MTEILVTGSSVIDFVYEVDTFPDRPEKYAARDARIVGGGCAGNAAVAIARLGAHARIAARAGTDLIGDLMRAQLEAEGVDTSLVLTSPQARSAFSSIYVDPQGERQILAFRGANMPDHLPEDAIGTPDAILCDTRWVEGARTALAFARRHGLPGVLDGEAPVPAELVERASHVGFSAQGLRDFTGLDALDAGLAEAASRTAAWVCVTDGGAGTFWRHGDDTGHVPAAQVTPIDTLGAGDVWHGAFTLKLAERAPEPEAVAFANAAASLKCTRPGGRSGAPNRAETEDFMKRIMRWS